MSPANKKTKKKNSYCIETGCKSPATNAQYCRLHYIASWKKLKSKKSEENESRLEKYLDRLAGKLNKEEMGKLRDSLESDETLKDALTLMIEVEADPQLKETDDEFIEKFTRKNKIDEE